MANGDYGYFGKGDTGYAQYMAAETAAAAAALSPLRWWSCWCSSAWEAEEVSIAQGSLA